MATEREKIKNFLSEQVVQAPHRAKAYVYDLENKKRPKRNLFVKLKSYLQSYLQGDTTLRWVTLTGLRGAGKTTLLYQLFNEIREQDAYRLFLSLDQTKDILGASLEEVLSVYEDILGVSFEQLDKPLILFLDEAQYDPKWAIVIKTIYDRTPRVCVFVTGSAALHMNSNTDIARRSVYEKLFPLSFTEYQKISQQKYEEKGVGKALRANILNAVSAQDLYDRLGGYQSQVDTYYLGVHRQDVQKYLRYGSLPFMVVTHNETIIYEQINKTLDRVIRGDITQASNLSSDSISKIPGMLYALADMDAFNVTTLSNRFEMSRPTVSEILELLEQTEILHRVYPHGSHLNQTTRKPSKYLFSSPAFRSMYYTMMGSSISDDMVIGRLLEDMVGMYLYRMYYKKPGIFLTYDSAKGGADFIFGVGDKKIVVEVGAGKKGYRQVAQTAKKVKSAYSIVISESELSYDDELQAVRIPLKMFLLM